jgi:hypothetical protein
LVFSEAKGFFVPTKNRLLWDWVLALIASRIHLMGIEVDEIESIDAPIPVILQTIPLKMDRGVRSIQAI